MVSRSILLVAAAVLSGHATPLLAQGTAIISGTVRDQRGGAIQNALVVLDARTERKVAMSDSLGRYRFENVRVGRHELAAAFVRLITDVRIIDVGAEGLQLDIVLRQNTAILDTIHVVTRRTGVHGYVIAHEDWSPLAAAEVHVVGAGFKATTAADGRFDFSNVKRGAYLVYVKREGYQGRMLSVMVPQDSAIDLALTLDRSSSSFAKQFAMPLREFDRRMVWMNRNNTAVIPRQELRAHPGLTLALALRYSMSFLLKGLVIDDSTCVYVNGIHQPYVSVSDFPVEGIEAVEVYGSGADYTNTVTYRNGQKPLRLTGACGSAMPRTEMAKAMDARIARAWRPGWTADMPGARSNPARAEAVVIWRRP